MASDDDLENHDQAKRHAKGIVARMRTAPRYLSIPVGVGFIIGGTVLAPLPVFGVWMVPLGLAILAPHWSGADRLSRRLYWQKLKFLRWAIRNGFLRIKQVERQKNEDGRR